MSDSQHRLNLAGGGCRREQHRPWHPALIQVGKSGDVLVDPALFRRREIAGDHANCEWPLAETGQRANHSLIGVVVDCGEVPADPLVNGLDRMRVELVGRRDLDPLLGPAAVHPDRTMTGSDRQGRQVCGGLSREHCAVSDHQVVCKYDCLLFALVPRQHLAQRHQVDRGTQRVVLLPRPTKESRTRAHMDARVPDEA